MPFVIESVPTEEDAGLRPPLIVHVGIPVEKKYSNRHAKLELECRMKNIEVVASCLNRVRLLGDAAISLVET